MTKLTLDAYKEALLLGKSVRLPILKDDLPNYAAYPSCPYATPGGHVQRYSQRRAAWWTIGWDDRVAGKPCVCARGTYLEGWYAAQAALAKQYSQQGATDTSDASEAASPYAQAMPRGVPRLMRLMRPVMQTTATNCLQACVATILAIPIDAVPQACDGSLWDWDAFQDWLATRGLQAIEVTFGSGGTIYPVRKPVACIITGDSPRECLTGRHAVVGQLLGLHGFEVLHDPHPSGVGLAGEPTHAMFFVQIAD